MSLVWDLRDDHRITACHLKRPHRPLHPGSHLWLYLSKSILLQPSRGGVRPPRIADPDARYAPVTALFGNGIGWSGNVWTCRGDGPRLLCLSRVGYSLPNRKGIFLLTDAAQPLNPAESHDARRIRHDHDHDRHADAMISCTRPGRW